MGAAALNSGGEPHYAVIFSSVKRKRHDEGYEEMAQRMFALASSQPGFLGFESVRDESGHGITISYWKSEDDIRAWKQNAEHLVAQRLGQERWYESYRIRVCRVEREYGL